MQTRLAALRNSASVKVFFIGILVLLLLIPVQMIRGVIHDRTGIRQEAVNDIKRAWGGEQLVAAPILVLPYSRVETSPYGPPVTAERRVFLLPDELRIDVDLQPEIRYRGIFEVPTYRSTLRFSGTFRVPDGSRLKVDGTQVQWDKLYIAVAVQDPRAITRTPQIRLGKHTARFAAGGAVIAGMPPQITAAVPNPFEDEASGAVPFEFELNLNGTDSLMFLPLGETTVVNMQSPWPSPSFSGAYLPVAREITASGFSAEWEVPNLGRNIPQSWLDGDIRDIAVAQSAFGVDIYVPVGLYQLALRATSYAVLFIGLTFVAFFLFELLAGLRLHMLQYLLIGFANSLFYLLLLSLAEHLGFGSAYALSALASSSLIVAYSASVLRVRHRSALMAFILAGLYGFLYVTLNAETYALLVGSIGLWVILAAIMYLTRRIEWDALPVPGKRQSAET